MSGTHGIGLVPSIEANLGPCLADPTCPTVQVFLNNGDIERLDQYPVDVVETIESCEKPCELAAKCAQFVIMKGTY